MKKLIDWAQGYTLFWKLYFWWGIRRARKERIANEKRMAAFPKLTSDEYWEQKNNKNES